MPAPPSVTTAGRPASLLLRCAALLLVLPGVTPAAAGKEPKPPRVQQALPAGEPHYLHRGVIDNDPSRIHASKDIRVTSNGVVVALGKGEGVGTGEAHALSPGAGGPGDGCRDAFRHGDEHADARR